MKIKIQYDIFLSYRRSSFESAQMIATSLKAKGYRVFFDVESLRGGKFNEQLFDIINNSTDFIVVLPEGALDRCHEPEDWVRKEVCHALNAKKNIIPIMLAGFEWPEEMPDGMEDLKMYQAVKASSKEYYDLVIQRLCSYLKSQPKRRIKAMRALRITGAVTAAILLLFGVLRLLSVSYCHSLGADILKDLHIINVICESNLNIGKEWNSFAEDIGKAKNERQILCACNNILDELDRAEHNILDVMPSDSSFRDLSLLQSLMLMSRGIKSLDVTAEPYSIYLSSSQYLESIRDRRSYVKSLQFDFMTTEMYKQFHEVSHHLVCSDYYNFLALLTNFPKSVKKEFEEIYKSSHDIPSEIILWLSSKEYENRAKKEFDKANALLDKWDAFIDAQASGVEPIEKILIENDGCLDSQ